MTTGWLPLLVIVVSSQSVDSQSTTDDETCSDDGGPLMALNELKSDMRRLLNNQQQLFQQHQTILNRLGNCIGLSRYIAITTFCPLQRFFSNISVNS